MTIHKYSEISSDVRVEAKVVSNSKNYWTSYGPTSPHTPISDITHFPKKNVFKKQIKIKILGLFTYWRTVGKIVHISSDPHLLFNENVRKALAL